MWHGCEDTSVTKILKNGFQREASRCGRQVHGRGTNFARSATMALWYATQKQRGSTRTLLLCTVVVGTVGTCDAEKNAAPLKDGSLPMTMVSPNKDILVTYKDNHARVEFIVVVGGA